MSEQRDELSHRAHRAHQQCLFAANCESKALNKNLLCLVAHHSLPPFSPQLRVPLHTVIPAMPHNSALRQTNTTTQSARAILKKKKSPPTIFGCVWQQKPSQHALPPSFGLPDSNLANVMREEMF
jgi:hypothetical protein